MQNVTRNGKTTKKLYNPLKIFVQFFPVFSFLIFGLISSSVLQGHTQWVLSDYMWCWGANLCQSHAKKFPSCHVCVWKDQGIVELTCRTLLVKARDAYERFPTTHIASSKCHRSSNTCLLCADSLMMAVQFCLASGGL